VTPHWELEAVVAKQEHDMRSSIVFTLLAVAASTLAAFAQTVNLQPGQYEYTLEMNLGIPEEGQKAVMDAAGFDKQKKLECLTAEDVKDMKNIAQFFAREGEEMNCKMTGVKTTGNKVTFNTTCEEDDVKVTSTTEMTFGTNSFTALTKGKDNEGRVTTIKASAKRIGECPNSWPQ
jgi:ribosomal protein S13